MRLLIRSVKLNPSAVSLPWYLWFCHVDAHKKEKLANEQVEAKVFVDGVAVALQASEEAEGEEADGQTDKRYSNAHPGDDSKEHLMHAPLPLQRNR